MLSYSDITAGKYIVLDGQPYEVLSSTISKKSRQKAANQTKIKNVITGKVTERAFHQSDNLDEADLTKKPVVYIYSAKGECWFHYAGKPSERFSLPQESMHNKIQFMKEKMTLEALLFNEKIIGIQVPIKVDLLVAEAPPAVRGNTAQGGTKQITLETGAVVNAPLFINTGDIVRINTDTGEYAERVEKR
jgi:elongation factor P